MSYSLGLDVGSVCAKVALISEDGKAVYLDSEKITASPKSAVNSLISRLSDNSASNRLLQRAFPALERTLYPRS
jgi:activator of 2-hydroxyglutaryl-CoA dehydratase